MKFKDSCPLNFTEGFEMKKKHCNILWWIYVVYIQISWMSDHKFSAIAKKDWVEFVGIYNHVKPFISLASMIGVSLLLIFYFAFRKALAHKTSNPTKLSQLATFYLLTFLYNMADSTPKCN